MANEDTTLQAPPTLTLEVADEVNVADDIILQIDTVVKIAETQERRVESFISPFDEKGLEFLTMPFELYATANGFWKDKKKVIKLMLGFRLYRSVIRARVFAGISRGQWNYFIEIHPHFSDVIEDISAARQSDRMNKIIAADDWRAAAYLLEKESGTEFDKSLIVPPGGSRATEVNEAILDKDGKILVTRRSLELLKDHGNGTNQ